jgi:hypothetical protein
MELNILLAGYFPKFTVFYVAGYLRLVASLCAYLELVAILWYLWRQNLLFVAFDSMHKCRFSRQRYGFRRGSVMS